MAYELTHQEKAFIKAYRLCVGSAPTHEIEYFFEYRQMASLVDSKQEKIIIDGAEYWTHIEDIWLMWREAIEYARGHK